MTHHFIVADFLLSITFREDQVNTLVLMPSLRKFECNEESACQSSLTRLFTLVVDDATPVLPQQRRRRIRDFDTGNGHTIVDKTDEGGYQFVIKDLHGQNCAMLITNKSFTLCHCALNGTAGMRSFGLMNAVMLCFSYSARSHNTLLMHASLVRHEGKAYAFIAKSGTGKSTHCGLWLQHIANCDLMNDDNPIVRVYEDEVTVYGGPWSGKTPCYRNISAPLAGVVRIDRSPANSIERLKPVEAFVSMLPACATMKWDEDIYDQICDIVTRLVERVPGYILHCLPDEEAAHICHNTVHTYAK